MKPYKVIISGGGTGGHIYPAISIADEFRCRYPDSEILFVGARDRMEMKKVPKAGYRIKGLWISGIQRKLTLKNLTFPIKLVKSLLDARKIVRHFKPDIAVGTGGYASGPLLKTASSQGIPCLIQEQNSYAGITNRLLGSKVDKICTAYKGMQKFFPAEKIVLTGNPVRQDLHTITDKVEEAADHFGFKPNKPVLLILGGSLGAGKINEQIAKNLEQLTARFQIIWQCGKLYVDRYKMHSNDSVRVLDFIDRMDLAFAAADIIISRAGAGTISELCIVGKPVVLIPSPNVAEDHQTKNAEALEKEYAAILLKEQGLEENLIPTLDKLLQDSTLQENLKTNIRQLAKPQATRDIVNLMEKLLDHGLQ